MNTYVWLALPAVVMLLGGVLTLFWRPSRVLIALVQHFAAGIILAAVMVEVFPEMQRANHTPAMLIGGFALGVLFMYAIKLFGQRLEATGGASRAQFDYGLILTVFIDVALDGAIIGAGFAAGENVGYALAIGLSVEMLFLGMSLISDAINGIRAFWICAALSATVFVSAALGYYLLSSAPPYTIAITLAFSAAALLYLVAEELLIEAHELEEKSYSMLVLFLGFIGFWMISFL